jgi:hypothetical protein
MAMTKTQRDVASFLVRFTQDAWHDDQGEPKVAWRGHIRHIQGDEHIPFTDFSEAVAFMQRYMTELTMGSFEALSAREKAGGEDLLQETFRLWEKSAADYAEVMFGAIGQTMQQTMEQTRRRSETLKRQMDSAVRESLRAWTPGFGAEAQPILDGLRGLQDQVRTLAERVTGLEEAIGGLGAAAGAEPASGE